MLAKTLGIAVAAAVLSSAATYTLLDKRLTPIETRMAHTPPIMVWDTMKLAGFFTRNDGRREDVLKAMERIGQEMKKLHDAGYLILSRDAVSVKSLPPSLDIHKEVVEKIASEFSLRLEEDANSGE